MTRFPTRLVETAIFALIVLFVLSVVLGAGLGRPVVLGYVETGSMKPALSPGDGFVAVPSELVGSFDTGDVVVFRAERLNGGGLTTHRLASETANGYTTKGDANPSLDQAAGEPLVSETQIVAKVLTVGGEVVVIPHLGTVITGLHDVMGALSDAVSGFVGFESNSNLPFALLGVVAASFIYLWDVWKTSTSTGRERKRTQNGGTEVRTVALVMASLFVLAVTAAMVVPSGATMYDFVSSNHDTPGTNVIGVSSSEETTYNLENTGLFPVVSFLHTNGDGIAVTSTTVNVAPNADVAVPVTLTAPDETGYVRYFVVEHRYIAILPTSVLYSLYIIHPWLPIVVIDTLVGIPFYLLGVALLGTGRIRVRSKNRTLPLSTRIRRLIRTR
ncbi:S26 family signal peptidase [Haloferax sp. DFSO52]|uniref:S26 family signal peptidase n=1 Tax=Haloferax sp. DFSO52 TaxID=3388505 RepID=UPI003A8A44E1